MVVKKSGIPVGAIVSMDDLARLKHIDENRAALLEAMREAQQGFVGLPPDEIEAEIEGDCRGQGRVSRGPETCRKAGPLIDANTF